MITDEIYEHLTYGDNVFVSMPTLVPELADQCVIVNGVAKTYAMTGWRVGWMIGPDDVMKAAINFQCHATSNVTNVAQRAALAAVSRRPRRRRDDARGVRPSGADHVPNAQRRSTVSPASSPRVRSTATPNLTGLLGRPIDGVTVDQHAGARRPRARRGQGRVRARRGVRRSAATPASRSPSATTTSSRASTASPPSSTADVRARPV